MFISVLAATKHHMEGHRARQSRRESRKLQRSSLPDSAVVCHHCHPLPHRKVKLLSDQFDFLPAFVDFAV